MPKIPDFKIERIIPLSADTFIIEGIVSGKTQTMTISLSNLLANSYVNTIRITDADSPYNIAATNQVIFADTDGGTITANLPAGIDGLFVKIVNVGSSSNNITVDPNGTEQLFGGGAGVSFDLIDSEIIDIHFETTENWW